jgi:hypothetical protein
MVDAARVSFQGARHFSGGGGAENYLANLRLSRLSLVLLIAQEYIE